jgi:hypothetical protein
MVGPKYTFKMTNEEYQKYKQWCHKNHLDSYAGASGSRAFY